MANGGRAVARALEDEGALCVFGVPGTHNIGLYDALRDSRVRAVLAHDERAAAFMADGVSRASTAVGVLSVVPGAGLTHALSGVAEAFLDQIPMVVLACAVRSDLGRAFQLHDIDQAALLAPVVKAALRPRRPEDLYGLVREAFRRARESPAGPVAVEVPAELYLLDHGRRDAPYRPPARGPRTPDPAAVAEAARRLNAARRPVLYAGNGCREAAAELRSVAERLTAPVATTLQGKGVFPERHPAWLWNGLGLAAPPFVRRELAEADAVLAVGCRFGEVATGSYGVRALPGLIHVDADPSVFHRNHPAAIAVEADAALFLAALAPLLRPRPRDRALEARLEAGHAEARIAAPGAPGRVSPAALFAALEAGAPDAVYAADSGNGLFLAMERLRLDRPGRFLAPVDFSCMGYAVPAAIGAKLARGSADAVAIVGDGAFLMTGLSLTTAAAERAGVLICVLRDGELGQIAQFQRMTYGRTSCVRLPDYDLGSIARGAGASFLRVDGDAAVGDAVAEGLRRCREGDTVVLEVPLDVSSPTYFTRGVISANFRRLPARDKLLRAVAALRRGL